MPFSKNSALILLFCLFCFFLYLFTAPTFMLWLDSARFVSAIVTLGVSNPPEPFYILLAHPFIYLPFGSIIFRLQMFSALMAALTLFFLFKLIMLILQDSVGKPLKGLKLLKAASFFGVGSLAFSYQFWSQAQNIETFILVCLISVVSLYLIAKAEGEKSFFINLVVITILLGLATGTNPVVASIFPSILLMMVLKRRLVTRWKFALWLSVGVTAIVLVHLYIPIRASQHPFLNYWNATDLVSVWKVSTGADLNVYVPTLGRINGFTGSLNVFFSSTFNYFKHFFLKFTPFILPFIITGFFYLWAKNKTYFFYLFLVVLANWFFSSIYFSGNQESWYLLSDIAWVIFASLGYLYISSDIVLKILNKWKVNPKYNPILLVILVFQLLLWLPFLNRRDWVLTEDYLNNLYQPIGDQKAIVFGSSDLFDATSFLIHDVPGTPVYKPNIIPITDNLFYIYKWYRDNLKANTGLEMPDDSNLKYDSTAEYSQFVADFFNKNIQKYKIYVTTAAIRNNFLQAYGSDQGSGIQISDKFNLIPQGTLFEVLPKEATGASNLVNFDYQFHNGFPQKKPFMLETTYQNEMKGMLNEYAYSDEGLGDQATKLGKMDQGLAYYQKAYGFNPKNAEIISRLGNYFGGINNPQKASDYFEQALKIEPDNLGIIFNLAFAYQSLGQKDKALVNYNKVIGLGKDDPKMAQLAKDKIAELNSGQGNPASPFVVPFIQPVPDGFKLYKNRVLDIQFVYPKNYTITESPNQVKLTNNLSGLDELTYTFFGQRLNPTESLEGFSRSLPKIDGLVVATQNVAIEGFEATGKTYVWAGHITFLVLMKRANQAVVVKIYPGDTNRHEDFNQIIQSIKPAE